MVYLKWNINKLYKDVFSGKGWCCSWRKYKENRCLKTLTDSGVLIEVFILKEVDKNNSEIYEAVNTNKYTRRK